MRLSLCHTANVEGERSLLIATFAVRRRRSAIDVNYRGPQPDVRRVAHFRRRQHQEAVF
jgi:hypothetical protein